MCNEYNMMYMFMYVCFRETPEVPEFRKKQNQLLRKIFGSLCTSNQIYILWNYIAKYVYIKNM